MKMKKSKWSEWVHLEYNIPTKEVEMDEAIESVLPKYAKQSTSSCTSACLATAISYNVDAFVVMASQNRERRCESYYESDYREVNIGHIIRVTRYSRWEGEGISKSYFFVPGDVPAY